MSIPLTHSPRHSVVWRPLALSETMPARCYHDGFLLEENVCGGGGPKLIIFGGQGTHRALLGDTWVINLRTGLAKTLVTLEGAPPSPRIHHTFTLVGSPQAAPTVDETAPRPTACRIAFVIGGCSSSESKGDTFIATEGSLYILRVEPSGHATWQGCDAAITLLQKRSDDPTDGMERVCA